MKRQASFSIPPDAFSKDHFLINQGLLSNIPYGAYMSNRNGCGWIAAYNYLHALSYPISAREIHDKLQKVLPLNGRIGTHLFLLYIFLMCYVKKRLHLSVLTPIHARKYFIPKAGILMYHTGKEFHFVAFQYKRKGHYRFFNAIYGNEWDILTLKDFFKNRCRFPLAFVIH